MKHLLAEWIRHWYPNSSDAYEPQLWNVGVPQASRVVAGPCCATENTGGELTGKIGVELVQGHGKSAAGTDGHCGSVEGPCCSDCDRSYSNADNRAGAMPTD